MPERVVPLWDILDCARFLRLSPSTVRLLKREGRFVDPEPSGLYDPQKVQAWKDARKARAYRR